MRIDTVFKKMLLLCLSISLGSLLCTAFLIGTLLEQALYGKTEQQLISKANYIHSKTNSFLNGEMSKEMLKEEILLLRSQDQIGVNIVTANQKSILSEENPSLNLLSTKVQKSSSTLFERNEKLKLFVAGIPLLSNEKRIGSIILYTPMTETETLIQTINRIILLSTLALIIPIVLSAYLLSKKFTRPIIAINETVKNMAAGHFGERVSVYSKDELASLGDSINEMAQRLSTIEKNRTQFIGEISHELRTPLTTIRTTLQGISEGIVNVEEDHELISISAEETKRLGTLIDELLDLSAFEEKSVILSRETLSLTDLLEKCLLLFKTKASEKNISIHPHLEKNVFVDADPDRLKQVIINLLDNAIKHSALDSFVEVNLFEKRHYTQVHFINYGAPIPKEELPYIFERFYKIDKSRTKKGSGLGLTISKQIMELHKGSLTVHSDAQKTIFTLNFLHKEASH